MSSALGHIGRYELLARLGAGGMGEIFLARTTGSGGFEKRVVIKRILPHLAGDPDFVQRFVDEGKLVVQLRHACIAQVLDMGEDAGATYIAMEHVDGRDLAELSRLARASRVDLPMPLAVTVLVRLLEALDYAHHATDAEGRPMGIIHRDVSPSNVMISKNGEVKLLDFGIARAAERAHVTVSGAIRGKYGYMSPEQAKGGELDARSDLFSVGVVAWELLTGARPFDAPSDLLTLDRVRFHDPGSLCDAAPEVPVDVGAVIDRLLRKSPDDRFQSAAAALRALHDYLQRVGAVVLSRDVAAWFETVQATLPEALRDRPVGNLSLDDALVLGLGAGLSPANGVGGTAPAPPRTPGTVAVAPLGPAAGVVLRASTDELPVPPRGSRRGTMIALVTVNLLLIALVAWFVLRQRDDGPRAGAAVAQLGEDVQPEEVGASDAAGTDPEGPPDARAALVAGVDEDAQVAPAPSADTGPVAPPDVAPSAELLAGALTGDLLGSVEAPVEAAEVTILFRATPDGASVTLDGRGTAPAPRRVTVPAGTHLRATVKADGYVPRTVLVVADANDVVNTTLALQPMGAVTFRFRPAQNTRVLIDGKNVDPGGKDVITHPLTAGGHRLVLIPPSGQRLERSFDVAEGKTVSLGTLDAAKED